MPNIAPHKNRLLQYEPYRLAAYVARCTAFEVLFMNNCLHLEETNKSVCDGSYKKVSGIHENSICYSMEKFMVLSELIPRIYLQNYGTTKSIDFEGHFHDESGGLSCLVCGSSKLRDYTFYARQYIYNATAESIQLPISLNLFLASPKTAWAFPHFYIRTLHFLPLCWGFCHNA